MHMNRSELIVKIGKIMKEEGFKTTAKQIRIGIDSCFDRIVQGILEGSQVKIKDFGVFDTKTIGPRLGYNPFTGRKFFIKSTEKAYFRPAAKLKASINTCE